MFHPPFMLVFCGESVLLILSAFKLCTKYLISHIWLEDTSGNNKGNQKILFSLCYRNNSTVDDTMALIWSVLS